MFGGPIRGSTARVWVALIAVALFATATRTATASKLTSVPRLQLDVLLTIAPDLSVHSRGTLIAEAARIWRREQVELRWPAPAGGVEAPRAPLRVLVISRPEAAAAGEERWPVAELLPHAGARALAIASISGAQRVVSEAARYRLIELPSLAEHRLGLVLGRAVAHEIGHFLLATGTHADRGLMRATVGADEFVAVGVDTFRLDDAASQWIRERLIDGAPAVDTLRASGFSYARP
jgi:hypothetical protein